MPAILIPFPESNDTTDLLEYFSRLTQNDDGDVDGPLVPALDLDLEDKRASVHSIEIEDVEAQGDMIYINYTIEFSAYYGCADMDYADADSRHIRGIRRDNHWSFEQHVSPEPLAPNEEL